MADESHATSNSFSRVAIVDRAALAFFAYGLLDGIAGDTDFCRHVDQLIEGEAAISRIIHKVVEARGDVDDVSHFVAREPPLLPLSIHGGECTGAGRSVFRQIDIDNIGVGQRNGAIPSPQMGRLLLVARNAGSGRRIIGWCAHVAFDSRYLGEAPQNHA